MTVEIISDGRGDGLPSIRLIHVDKIIPSSPGIPEATITTLNDPRRGFRYVTDDYFAVIRRSMEVAGDNSQAILTAREEWLGNYGWSGSCIDYCAPQRETLQRISFLDDHLSIYLRTGHMLGEYWAEPEDAREALIKLDYKKGLLHSGLFQPQSPKEVWSAKDPERDCDELFSILLNYIRTSSSDELGDIKIGVQGSYAVDTYGEKPEDLERAHNAARELIESFIKARPEIEQAEIPDLLSKIALEECLVDGMFDEMSDPLNEDDPEDEYGMSDFLETLDIGEFLQSELGELITEFTPQSNGVPQHLLGLSDIHPPFFHWNSIEIEDFPGEQPTEILRERGYSQLGASIPILSHTFNVLDERGRIRVTCKPKSPKHQGRGWTASFPKRIPEGAVSLFEDPLSGYREFSKIKREAGLRFKYI